MRAICIGIALSAVVVGNPVGLAMMKAELGNLPNIIWTDFSISQFSPILGGFSLFLASFFLWVVLIGVSPLSTIQPTGLALMMTVTATISYWWLGEQLNPIQLFGTTMIILGVLFLANNGHRRSAAYISETRSAL